MSERPIKKEVVSDDEDYGYHYVPKSYAPGPSSRTRGRHRQERRDLEEGIELSKKFIKEEILDSDDDDASANTSSSAHQPAIAPVHQNETLPPYPSSTDTPPQLDSHDAPLSHSPPNTPPILSPPPRQRFHQKTPPRKQRRLPKKIKIKKEPFEFPGSNEEWSKWHKQKKEMAKMKAMEKLMHALRDDEKTVYEENLMREIGATRTSARLQKKRVVYTVLDRKSDMKELAGTIKKQSAGIQKTRTYIRRNNKVVKEEVDTWDESPSESNQPNQQVVAPQQPQQPQPQPQQQQQEEEFNENETDNSSDAHNPPIEEAVNGIAGVAEMLEDLANEERREREMELLEQANKATESTTKMNDYGFGLIADNSRLVELDIAQDDFESIIRGNESMEPMQKDRQVPEENMYMGQGVLVPYQPIDASHASSSIRVNREINRAISENHAMNDQEFNQFLNGFSEHNKRKQSELRNGFVENHESKRGEITNGDFYPASSHNTPSKDTRPEGDQQDQGMSSTPSKRRNTNNSQCASLLSDIAATVARASAALDSDDDSGDDDMSSIGEQSEHGKRPRTPRGRYSPEAQRRAHSRLSALSVDTHRNTDLNADGSGPSSSSAASQFTPDPDRLPNKRKSVTHSAARPRKRRSPSVQMSQDELNETDTEDEEIPRMPIITDDPNYSARFAKNSAYLDEVFEEAKRITSLEYDTDYKTLAAVYANVKDGEQARFPERIHIGAFVIKTWYGSPFPAEYVKAKTIYICEYCLHYSRSDQISQNHAKKCTQRAPPGVEIYRKDNISVFEVDGRKQKNYCQTLCLISRMFLESKTVFYDTEPFFFYVATINNAVGCRFAGYFSKEKYAPDINNLSCIMTLPCYQDKGLGRFLIDVSYALSRKEKWNGGPEQPLSDLGRKAYGGYWRTVISVSCSFFKQSLENGPGLSINMIADHTGINSHDVLEVVGGLGWIRATKPNEQGIYSFEWDIDWDLVDMIIRETQTNSSKKTQFSPKCLDWVPRKMRPTMDGFREPTEKAEDEDQKRKNSLLKTPVHDESMETATPTSTSMPLGSVKKEIRGRGHNRSVGRNLKLEVSKRIKVPEPIEGKEMTDEEEEKRRMQKKIKKSLSRCSESSTIKERRRDDSPDDDKPGPSNRTFGRRSRSGRRHEEEPSTSSDQRKSSISSGRGRHRTRMNGEKFEDTDEPSDESSSDDNDDKPFGSKVKNGKIHRGRRGSKKRRSVSGKKFPLNFGVRPVASEDSKPGPSDEKKKEEVSKETNAENTDAERTAASDMDETHEDGHLHPTEEELAKNYNIGTPESYHSTPPLSPQPQVMAHHFDDDDQFEENDAAPPLLVSEVQMQNESDNPDRLDEAPPLVQNMGDGEGYSSGDDDAPPRLSPQYKNEDEDEMIPMNQSAAPPQLQTQESQNGMNYEEPRSYHDPMSAGPSSSIHVTPQMNQIPNSQQNMMTPTQHYSQPNSQQQATPGSGGIPSCGPVYNHSTPEQQNQQFMSPQMAGMPASVSSVHSVHNNNSMEMVGGPASLQHTPQQYDIGHSMGQMPQDNGQMVNNVQNIEQQNQMMMQQHGFNSPPMPQAVPTPQQQQQVQQQQVPPAPPAPIVPAPAIANGRRRSESAATTQRKQRQRAAAAPAAQPQVIPPHMAYPGMPMMPHMPMTGYPFAYGYQAYQHMPENGFYPYNTAYYPNMFNPQMDPNYHWRQMAAINSQQMQDGNGTAAAGTANYQFPPGAPQMPYFQNNTR